MGENSLQNSAAHVCLVTFNEDFFTRLCWWSELRVLTVSGWSPEGACEMLYPWCQKWALEKENKHNNCAISLAQGKMKPAYSGVRASLLLEPLLQNKIPVWNKKQKYQCFLQFENENSIWILLLLIRTISEWLFKWNSFNWNTDLHSLWICDFGCGI